MKVSKVVLIVVALHVLVIGGIFIFEGCSRTKAPTPDIAANESPAADETAANQPALPAESMAQNLTPAQPTSTAPAPTTVAPTQPAARTYVVKKGDSLWKIAKAEQVSIIELTKANNLTKASAIKIGQKLQIPAKAVTMATASVVPTTTDSTAPAAAGTGTDGNAYIVKSGDSLWKIARTQKVTVAALKQVNNLTSDSLKIGQKLHIPATTVASSTTPSTPATTSAGVATPSYGDWHEPGTAVENGQTVHYVDVGESPAIIAKKYSVKVDDLMKANNVSDARRIVVGQRLIIPTQPAAVPAATVSTTPATPAVTAPIVAAKPVATAN